MASEIFYRNRRADFSVSSNNVLAYQPANRKNLQLGWFDRAGRLLQNIGSRNDYYALRLWQDERRLIFTDEEDAGGHTPIWVMDVERGLISRISTPLPAFFPVWSPDGTDILYTADNEQRMQVLRQSPNNFQSRSVLNTPGPKFLSDWSADGRFAAYSNSVAQLRTA